MSTFPFFPIASEELRDRSLVQALEATADTPLSRARQIVGFPAGSIGGSPWPASRLAFGCFVAVCVISLFSWNSLAGAYPPAPKQGNIEVVDAVREFNEENKRLGLGLDQPPLTEDEIVTAIKRNDRKRDAPDVSEREFAAFKAVAETHRLPKGAYLRVWTSEEPEPFTVVHKWQVQLYMPTPEAGFHGFTIRNTTIREEQIDPKSVAWGKPDSDGLSLGLFLLPRKDKYAIGDRVRLRLFVRNDGRKAVEEMTFWNITWPETKDFTATDQTGAKFEVRNSQSKEWSGPAWIAGARGGGLDPGDVHAFRIPFELGIGGDGSNKLIGRVIDARPGQTLQLRLRAHNGSTRIPAENEPRPESGSVTFTVVAAGDDAGEQAEDKATANRASTFSATAASLGDDHDDSENQPLPQRQFRVTVTDVVSDDLVIVKRVAIETHQNSWIQVTSDSPGGGGLTHRRRSTGGDEHAITCHLVILGDRLLWEPGGVDVLKFYLSLQGAIMSSTGPMPKGIELSDVFKVSLKSGTYPYESPVAVLQFRDVSYRLVVTDGRASD